MSDDEYYAGSPYDDFEDMLWDADPAPDLADDLAQHAAYSPVWQDDPTGELEAYHSDWEYYSDDYYDDDPSILKDNPVGGSPLQGKNMSKTQAPKRGRKRKHEETRQRVDAEEHIFLSRTIQGTVWASGTPPETKVFREGQQETVGLLVDWKEKFKLDNGQSRTFGQGQLKRDESWANDLSLVDMGLTHIRERAGAHTSMEDDADDAELDEEEEEDLDLDAAQDLEGMESALSGEQQQGSSPNPPPQQNGHRQCWTQATDQNGDRSDHGNMSEAELNDTSTLNKRRKLSKMNSPSQDQGRDLRATKKGSPHAVDSSGEIGDPILSQGRNRPRRQRHATGSDELDAQNTQNGPSKVQKRSTKRRLSSDLDDSQDVSTSTMDRRSKRVASEKLQTSQDSRGINKTQSPVTRSKKLRKK